MRPRFSDHPSLPFSFFSLSRSLNSLTLATCAAAHAQKPAMKTWLEARAAPAAEVPAMRGSRKGGGTAAAARRRALVGWVCVDGESEGGEGRARGRESGVLSSFGGVPPPFLMPCTRSLARPAATLFAWMARSARRCRGRP